MLVKVLVILFFIYLFLRVFGKYLMPLLLKWYLMRVQKRFMSRMQQPPPPAGDPSPRKSATEKKRKNPDFGEYVDYEEINNK